MFEKFVNAEAEYNEHIKDEKKENIDLINESSKDNNNNNNINTIEDEEICDLNKIRENIYKTYTKTIDNGKQFMNDEKAKMKMILDLLIYTQMKKVELKINYFNEFERIIEFETGQLKSVEIGLIQDRIKLGLKKIEFNNQIEKIKSSYIENQTNTSL